MPSATAVKYFDDGWRLGVVYATGPRYVSILDFARLRAVKLDAAERAFLKPARLSSRHLALGIERRRRLFKRNGIGHAAKLARRVACQLRGAPY